MLKTLTSREERELEHFESLAKEHGYDWWGHNTPASKFRMQRRIDLLKTLLNIKPGDKILECGCGSGDFTLKLANVLDNDIFLTSIDLSPSQIKIASNKVNKPNVNFELCSITDTGYKDKSFNFIIGNSILHHLDFDKALSEIRRILKDNGKILFFEPNMMNPQVWLSFNINFFRDKHEASPDETAFFRWELKKQLRSLGFKNITVDPFDFIYPLIPNRLLNIAKKIEGIIEKTFIREIAGSLIVFAEK